MIDPIEDIDWGRAWIDRQVTRKDPDDPDKWNKRAKDYGQASGHSDYTVRFIEMMDAKPGESVLDIGSGPGTLSIPLAEAGHPVTAMDFSQGMLDVMSERITDEGSDITPVRAAWEDDWAAAGIGEHDIVIASRSTMVADLSAAIDKLTSYARRRVCMTLVANHSPRTDDRLLAAIGRDVDHGYDFMFALMLLFQKGHAAELRYILSEKYDRYESFEDALEQSTERIEDPTPEELEAARRYLEEHLIHVPDEHETRPYRKDYKRYVRWAFISWDVGESGMLHLR